MALSIPPKDDQESGDTTLQEMRAALYDRYGAPEVLYEGKLPVPIPNPGEVLVRVHACSVNGIDTIVRSGALRLITGRKFPRKTGDDFVGEIASVVPDTPKFHVGDRVWGFMPHAALGSVAEFVSVPCDCIAYTPQALDLVQAAALPVVGATALIALQEIAKLKAGERLLVRGASGGVGLVAVQLGRELQADVTGLANSRNLDFVRELGADKVFDYSTTQAHELGSFDVILDTVGSELSSYRRLLAPKGRMVTIAIDPKRPVSALLYIFGSAVFGTRRVRFFSAQPKSKVLAELTNYVEKGAIRPIIDTVYAFAEITAAHRAFEKGGRRGKQIVVLL